jgi:dTMP kinase
MSSPTPGLFIVIEGMDGAGKTDSTEAMVTVLEQFGLPVHRTYEVGGTPIGKELRNLAFRQREDESLDPVARMMMIYASRIQHLRQVVWPKTQAGTHVVSDRFWMSSRVYQGALDGQNDLMDELDQLPGLRMCAAEPDVIIYLNVLPETAHARGRSRANVDNDTYKRDLEHAKKIKHAYDDVMIKLSRSAHTKLFEINANLDRAAVAQQLVVVAREIVEMVQKPRKVYRRPAEFRKM